MDIDGDMAEPQVRIIERAGNNPDPAASFLQNPMEGGLEIDTLLQEAIREGSLLDKGIMPMHNNTGFINGYTPPMREEQNSGASYTADKENAKPSEGLPEATRSPLSIVQRLQQKWSYEAHKVVSTVVGPGASGRMVDSSTSTSIAHEEPQARGEEPEQTAKPSRPTASSSADQPRNEAKSNHAEADVDEASESERELYTENVAPTPAKRERLVDNIIYAIAFVTLLCAFLIARFQDPSSIGVTLPSFSRPSSSSSSAKKGEPLVQAFQRLNGITSRVGTLEETLGRMGKDIEGAKNDVSLKHKAMELLSREGEDWQEYLTVQAEEIREQLSDPLNDLSEDYDALLQRLPTKEDVVEGSSMMEVIHRAFQVYGSCRVVVLHF